MYLHPTFAALRIAPKKGKYYSEWIISLRINITRYIRVDSFLIFLSHWDYLLAENTLQFLTELGTSSEF